MFICPHCREKLNGRSISSYVADLQHNESSHPQLPIDLSGQMQKLTEAVEGLSKKMDNMPHNPPKVDGFDHTPSTLSATPVWPVRNAKRRRADRMPIEITSDRGTNTVDLSDLSVPSVASVAAQKCFWLYLSGLNPKITDSDVTKIVSRCLNATEPVAVIRLVQRGVDTSNFSYVSYKIGLDPAVKPLALDPASWPDGLLFREFVDRPKN